MFLVSSGITGYSSSESILKLIGLIVLCGLIIAASYFVTRLIGKREAGGLRSGNFKTIEAYRLSQNKYLQLIKICSRYMVIAVCKDTVTCICELSEDEVQTSSISQGGVFSFRDVLSKYTKKESADDAHEEDPDASGQHP